EMALMADHLIVIGRGRIIADQSLSDFMSEYASNEVIVRTTDLRRAAQVLDAPGIDIRVALESLTVRGLEPAAIGDALFASGLPVHELSIHRSSLEDVFMELTADSVQFRTHLEGASA